MCNLHLFMKENLCRFLEFILTLCCEISARACFGYHLFHLRMAVQIIFQTVCYILSLRNHSYAIRKILHNAAHKKRIMRATQNNGINISVLQHQLVDAFLYEIISSPDYLLHWLPRWQPKADKPRHSPESRPKFRNFHIITLAFNSTFCSQKSHVITLGNSTNYFGSRADNTRELFCWDPTQEYRAAAKNVVP